MKRQCIVADGREYENMLPNSFFFLCFKVFNAICFICLILFRINQPNGINGNNGGTERLEKEM